MPWLLGQEQTTEALSHAWQRLRALTQASFSVSTFLHIKQGFVRSVTNNQEGTGGGTLSSIQYVCVWVCALILFHPVRVLLWETRFPWCENGLTHTDCHSPEHQPIVHLPSGGKRTYSGTSVGSEWDHYTTTDQAARLSGREAIDYWGPAL